MALVAKQVYVTQKTSDILMAEGKRRGMTQQDLLHEIIEEAVALRTTAIRRMDSSNG